MSANLSLDAIRARAAAFAHAFKSETYEMGQAQNFIRGLCGVFGLSDLRAVSFEHRAKKVDGKNGRIDGFFPGLLLIEMKSAGEDLEKAYEQATGYLAKLKTEELPRHIMVCDFANIHLYDREAHAEPLRFKLVDLVQNIDALLFMAGYEDVLIQRQEDINRRAAELIGNLHDAMRGNGYTGASLETYLVRLLFCLFADDTGLFGENDRFLDLLVNHTREDGSDLHGQLLRLFSTLDTAPEKRLKNLPEHMRRFTYVNGELFRGEVEDYPFNEDERALLISLAQENWAEIDPAIFGALFQHIMHHEGEAATAKTKKRRELGAHYTSETNILKAIKPLFMEQLWQEFEEIKHHKTKLGKFHDKLASLNIFDPACGCGNFLVVAYRELRLLELEVINALHGKTKNTSDIALMVRLDVDQFHGVEIDSTAAKIATVAMWLTDHQMNLKLTRLGGYMHRLPLIKRPNIVCGNALCMNWADVLPPRKCSYIVGNPPFVGHQWRSTQQMDDMERVWGNDGRFGRLDYVTCWHKLAAAYMKVNPSVLCALVSTNSICQGEQVGILWEPLLAQGIQIHFAHRTFQWRNEGRGVAAVHCIIVGFGLAEPKQRHIFDYGDNIRGMPEAYDARNINPYLVDAPNVILPSRTKTPIGLPQLIKGSQPTDGGHLILTDAEKLDLLTAEPAAEKWLRPYLGGEELINGGQRWCLWLKGIAPNQLNSLPKVMKRVTAVAESRGRSPTKSVKEFADKPTLFTQDRQPSADYLGLPEVSSENRLFIPIAFLDADTIASNKVQVVEGATLFHFGILCSTMHNAWMRTVAGRLKSDYSYSPAVYNNFPWPKPNAKQSASIEAAAQAVLDVRAKYPDSTLGQLYAKPMTCNELVDAHKRLDKYVDTAYGYKGAKEDAPRVAFLFELYQQLLGAKRQDDSLPEMAVSEVDAKPRPPSRKKPSPHQ